MISGRSFVINRLRSWDFVATKAISCFSIHLSRRTDSFVTSWYILCVNAEIGKPLSRTKLEKPPRFDQAGTVNEGATSSANFHTRFNIPAKYSQIYPVNTISIEFCTCYLGGGEGMEEKKDISVQIFDRSILVYHFANDNNSNEWRS